ncbi:MAG: hypothetical protein KatS3mg109_0069 [Pirellulaceae bacterium]|nr:MAG: hypothetical protein KatS3mg109_0069 [Pirellulaceae bacterium]
MAKEMPDRLPPTLCAVLSGLKAKLDKLEAERIELQAQVSEILRIWELAQGLGDLAGKGLFRYDIETGEADWVSDPKPAPPVQDGVDETKAVPEDSPSEKALERRKAGRFNSRKSTPL